MKVKAQMLRYEMRKLKERDEMKQTLDARIYPVVRIATVRITGVSDPRGGGGELGTLKILTYGSN